MLVGPFNEGACEQVKAFDRFRLTMSSLLVQATKPRSSSGGRCRAPGIAVIVVDTQLRRPHVDRVESCLSDVGSVLGLSDGFRTFSATKGFY